MKVTEHYNLSEFSRSATASRLGIDNTIPEALIPNIRNLCEQILEPLRAHINSPSPLGEGRGEAPVVISSGYRCKALNKAVGGVANSQHMMGEAVDIKPPANSPEGESLTPQQQRAVVADWAAWIMDNCRFDQLLVEKSGSAVWLHVSCKRDLSKNRQIMKVVETK